MKLFGFEINKIEKKEEEMILGKDDRVSDMQLPYVYTGTIKGKDIIIKDLSDIKKCYAAYKQSPSVYNTINKGANRVLTIPWYITKKIDTAGKENYNTLMNLFEFPNPYESFGSLLKKTYIRMKICRSAAWEIKRIDDIPKYIYFMEGNYEYVLSADKKRLKGIRNIINYNNEVEMIPYENLIWFPNPTPENIFGFNELEPIWEIIQTELKNINYNKTSIGKKSNLGDLFLADPNMSPENEERIKETLLKEYDKTDKLPFTFMRAKGLMDLDREPQGRVDYDYAELAKQDERIIKECFGLYEKENQPQTEFSDDELYQGEIKPNLIIMEYFINLYNGMQMYITDWGIEFAKYLPSLRAGARVADVFCKYGLGTRNQALKIMGLPPQNFPGFDEPIEPMQKPGIQIQNKMPEIQTKETLVLGDTRPGQIKKLKIEEMDENDMEQGYYYRGSAPILKKYFREMSNEFTQLKKQIKGRLFTSFQNMEKQEEINLANIDKEKAKKVVETIKPNYLTSILVDLNKESYIKGAENKTKELRIEMKFDVVPEKIIKKLKEKAVKDSEFIIDNLKNGDKSGKKGLYEVMAESLEKGDDIKETIKEVDRFFGEEWETWRSEQLVRTTLHNIMNEGRMDISEEVGIETAEIILGPNPCEECMAAAASVKTISDARQWQNAGTHFFAPNCQCVVI